MDAKITSGFDKTVITKFRKYAVENNISLSRLIEFLLNKGTSKRYQSLEDFPILDWVTMVSEGAAVYPTKPRKSKALKRNILNLKNENIYWPKCFSIHPG